jgi:hypothetical protein
MTLKVGLAIISRWDITTSGAKGQTEKTRGMYRCTPYQPAQPLDPVTSERRELEKKKSCQISISNFKFRTPAASLAPALELVQPRYPTHSTLDRSLCVAYSMRTPIRSRRRRDGSWTARLLLDNSPVYVYAYTSYQVCSSRCFSRYSSRVEEVQ